jgi:hypothetical protein
MIANIIAIIATLGMSVAAGFALYTWQKEFIGKKKIDLACQIMENVCNMRDLLFFVRSRGLTTLIKSKIIKHYLV